MVKEWKLEWLGGFGHITRSTVPVLNVQQARLMGMDQGDYRACFHQRRQALVEAAVDITFVCLDVASNDQKS